MHFLLLWGGKNVTLGAFDRDFAVFLMESLDRCSRTNGPRETVHIVSLFQSRSKELQTHRRIQGHLSPCGLS